ncbi:sulfotransferase domain-containing protein [bacterium]|nr:sulfotransferase domain-containing protein [bacterium]
MIVWLASYPRSGNTFIRLLLHHFFDVATHDLYMPNIAMPDPEERGNIVNLVGYRPYSSIAELDEKRNAAFVKTHELPDDDRPAIYVIRDGRDSITSYAHFILTVEEKCSKDDYDLRFDKTIRKLVTDDERFGGWGKHVCTWTGRPAPTTVVHYSQLQKRPIEVLQRALSHLCLDITVKKKRSRGNFVRFQDLHRLSPELFRKGKSGSFVDEMPNDVEEMFWERYGEVTGKFGYRRRNLVDRLKKFWRKGPRLRPPIVE